MNVIRAYESGDAQADLLTKGLQSSGQQVIFCNLDLQSVKEKLQGSLPVDVIHFHNASLFASRLSDKCAEKIGRYATFIHYDTSELRTRTEAVRFNPYANLHVDYQDESVTSRLQQLSRIFPACIVKEYEAAEYAAKYHSRVYIVPYAIDLKDIAKLSTSSTRSDTPPLIVHPCANESKGTEFIEEVMDRLRKEGYLFDYCRVENSSHADTLRKMQQADIIIDQILHGFYGIVSVEAMALGKPVISHIREDLKYKYNPTLPVISANPATLYRNLVPFLEDAGIRESAGKAGRKFVENHHQIDAVIKKLMWAYRNEIDNLQNYNHTPGNLDDQAIIFDLMTGNIVVVREETGTFDMMDRMTNSSPSPNKQNEQTIFDSMTDNTVALEADTGTYTGTFDIAGRVHKHTPKKRSERASSDSKKRSERASSDSMTGNTIALEGETGTYTATFDIAGEMHNHIPTKSIHVIEPKQISRAPFARNSFRFTQVRHLRPNRYYARRWSKNKTATYFSFDLSKIPLSSIITKAVIMLPVVLKKKQKVSIVRIKRNWRPKRAKRKPPLVFPKRIGQLSTKSASRMSKWKCTELVKRWHRKHLKNYGVRISKRLWKQPKLAVNFYKK